MSALARDLGAIAADTAFSGVVRVDGPRGLEVVRAYGLADRAHAIPNEADTQFGIASGSKGLTALVVMRLVEEGALSLSTTARSLLGVDLPLVDERVTVEHLLAHRSGIGDYLDEELDLDFTEYLLPVPAQHLATTEAYLEVLDGHPQKFPPGERFAYCNSGYVLLALIAERVSARPFPDLVRDLVCTPAGLQRYGLPPLGRAPRARGGRIRGGPGDMAWERLPPTGRRKRRRWHLHDRRGRGDVLARALRGLDRA